MVSSVFDTPLADGHSYGNRNQSVGMQNTEPDQRVLMLQQILVDKTGCFLWVPKRCANLTENGLVHLLTLFVCRLGYPLERP